MPNSPQPLTGEVARRWTQARMPRWAPWVLVVGAAVGIVLSIATDDSLCTPKDPDICGPDLAFAWAVALLVTGLLTLWVWPLAASLLVLGYVGLDLVYDPARPARVAFAVLGLLVLTYAAGHVALRRHQKATLEALTGPAHPPMRAARSWPRPVGVLIGAGVAALIAGTSGAWYAHQVEQTARHVTRSVVVDSVAGRVDDDGEQSFRLSERPAGAPEVVSILTAIQDYPEGSHQPVRVDLEDRDWVRLVAEPDDHTGWLSLSLGTGILAALLLGYAYARAMNRRRLAETGWAGVGTSVRVIGSQVWVSAADGSHATLATFATSDGQDEFRVRPGVLVGDLRSRGWAAVWTHDSVLLPLSRLSVEGGPPAMTDAAAERLRREHEDETDDLEIDTPWHQPAHSSEVHGGPSLAGRVNAKMFGRDGARRLDSANDTARRWSHSSPVVFLTRLGAVVVGAGFIWLGTSTMGATWAAAHGEGVPGTVTVTEVDCGGRGPCAHYGSYRSDDGELEFTDVNLINGQAEVGQAAKAFYEGEGEEPDEVYGPGWGGFVENGLFAGMGLSFVLFALGGILEPIMLRRRPRGRHARPL